MYPRKAAIRRCVEQAARAQRRASRARRQFRLSVRSFAVSPPALLAGVLTGIAAGRHLAGSHRQSTDRAGQPLKYLGPVLGLLRIL